MRKSRRLLVWFLALSLAFLVGYTSRGSKEKELIVEGPSALSEQGSDMSEGGLYICPMMHIAPVKRPGQCPVCGMDLVRISGSSHEQGGARPRVKLSREEARVAQLEVTPVERRSVIKEIPLYGRIDYDPAHLSYVNAYMPGVVNRVYVERAGVWVRWGEPLLDFYSWDLYNTEQQLFEAAQVVPGLLAFREGTPHVARKGEIESRGPRDEEARQDALRKMAAIRHKLRLLGLSKRDIDELQQRSEPTGIATLTAPRAGVVIRQNATEGMYVNTGSVLMVIADPKYLWLKLDAYETDIPWIRNGQEVEFQVQAFPGERFQGRVTYIDPIFNPNTRTTTVGVMAQETPKLKPEMVARAVIRAELSQEGVPVGQGAKPRELPLTIPITAPLWTGKRAIVYVAVPGSDHTYEAREVILGPQGRDRVIVKEGLEEGELVVTKGAFKLDSASQIMAKPSMIGAMSKEPGS